ncbi:MAG TPA: response regulator, partial [Polyangiales bacterium]|nr:response regulator [Polyangiales bacterium]
VESGDAAIARAAELRPDVVIADGSMSTDGYKVASAIRSTPGLERTAVILLASNKHPFDEARAKAAGVDDHVVKPFDTQHVIDKVRRAIAQPRASVAGARPAPPAPAPPAAPQARPAAPPAGGRTVAFDRGPTPAPQAAPAPRAAPPAPAQRPAAPVAQAAPPQVAAATAQGGELAQKLDGLGLSADQVAGVLALSRDVIEKIVWEVVPDLAETLIREEIRRLTQ